MENTQENYIGIRLLEKQLISQGDLEKALNYQKKIGGKLSSILVRIGAISEERLLEGYQEISDFAYIPYSHLREQIPSFTEICEELELDEDWWIDQEVFCFREKDNFYLVSTQNLEDSILELIENRLGGEVIHRAISSRNFLERIFDELSSNLSTSTGTPDAQRLKELAEEAPVIEFVNNILNQAFDKGASDIHIEPSEYIFDVRFRVDGVLFTASSSSIDRFPAISSRVKLISGMDISERRLPQDGRISMRLSGADVEVRVSAIPGVHGESIVMRLLPKEKRGFSLDSLGFHQDHLTIFKDWIRQPHGIYLVTGPTGSGKSTTLYSALEFINTRDQKIITVEDPVEYRVEGITQIQTHADIGYTFANALRSILRQDPDIIMIGEIRDLETAEIAVQASLTGHLVLSTLHTNDAAGAFARLVDMGVDPYLVASPVRGVMAQRLVRRLCQFCAVPTSPLDSIAERAEHLSSVAGIDLKDANWKKAVGCSRCQGTGYTSRLGIHELLPTGQDIKQVIMSDVNTEKIKEIAADNGVRTMRDDGIIKAMLGHTSLEEVFRVTII